jgi:hypothetical protein
MMLRLWWAGLRSMRVAATMSAALTSEPLMTSAIGFPMGEASLAQAIAAPAPEAPPAAPAASFAFKPGDPQAAADATAYQVSPYTGAEAAGRVGQQGRWDAAHVNGTGAARGLLAGAQRGSTGHSGNAPAHVPQTRADIMASYANQGARIAPEAT